MIARILHGVRNGALTPIAALVHAQYDETPMMCSADTRLLTTELPCQDLDLGQEPVAGGTLVGTGATRQICKLFQTILQFGFVVKDVSSGTTVFLKTGLVTPLRFADRATAPATYAIMKELFFVPMYEPAADLFPISMDLRTLDSAGSNMSCERKPTGCTYFLVLAIAVPRPRPAQ